MLLLGGLAGAVLQGPFGILFPGAAIVFYSLWQRDWLLWRHLFIVKGFGFFLTRVSLVYSGQPRRREKVLITFLFMNILSALPLMYIRAISPGGNFFRCFFVVFTPVNTGF
ncbi:MAG: hypothetical protein H0A75_05675 [Candidatus Methanofishera endochildressiae]|uniref:Uncharacterized protein n=1 Tax=Candidatus Methanofishera endochildressiae TaxID=2738884 RepID=A0A7Z0MPF2_9GAMM|nr:hypothetical protein [Candidatus Methanofishera endochildressiae]